MKIIFCFLSISFSLTVLGQKIMYNDKPSVYLDSNKIDLEYYYFDQNKIEKVDVIKKEFDSLTNTSGKIFITSKNPKEFNFISYAYLKSNYFSDKTKPILLLINGKFIKNASKINIDSSYIYKIEVESGADFDELKNIYPLLSIINIQTKNPDNLIEKRQVKLNEPDREIFLNGLPSKSLPE